MQKSSSTGFETRGCTIIYLSHTDVSADIFFFLIRLLSVAIGWYVYLKMANNQLNLLKGYHTLLLLQLSHISVLPVNCHPAPPSLTPTGVFVVCQE